MDRSDRRAIHREAITVGSRRLPADRAIPDDPAGVVIFAHGSGSSRLSPRNRYVAEALNQAGFATLLVDLLTEREAQDRRNVFDIALLASRVVEASHDVGSESSLAACPIGLFGASTGAAAALVAAAELSDGIAAVVSRGGRPDLALPVLHLVTAPTLLIVGGDDVPVIEMNERALARLECVARLDIVPGATHLFEEAGTLDRVIGLAIGWFRAHLGGGGSA